MKDAEYEYCGDINIEYGGFFAKVDDPSGGYADVVRVTDLDGGCGFTGAVLIERLTALIDTDIDGISDRMRSALECVGFDFHGEPTIEQRIDAALAYGLYDPSGDMWSPSSEVVQTDASEPMEYDGWKATKRIDTDDLRGYIEAEWCN